MKLKDCVRINPLVKLDKKDDYPFVEMKDIESFTKTVEASVKRKFSGSGSKFIHGDTLLARITPCLENGKTAQYRGVIGVPAWGSTEFIVLRGMDGVTDNDFVYYLSISEDFRKYAIQNMVGTSGRQRVPTDAVEKYDFEFPPLSKQKNIARILSSLDRKIELNYEMNKVIEGTATAIFKSWFLDFDPVCEMKDSKSSRLSTEISNLFPSKLIESEVGKIPQGWLIQSLGNVTEKFATGLNPRNNFKLGEGDNFYVTIKNLGDTDVKLDNKCDKVTNDALKKINARSNLKAGDVLFSGIGTIGKVNFIFKDPENWNISESVFTLRADSSLINEFFLFFLLKSRQLQNYALANSSGSVQKGIRMSALKAYKFPCPSKDILDEFMNVCKPLFSKLSNNLEENKLLSELRNILLPRLISGDLDISDAEKFLEEVGA